MNDLEVRIQCATCGAGAGEECRQEQDGEAESCPDGEREAFVPLRLIPESVIEQIRAEKLPTAIDAEAEELPSAPDPGEPTDEQLIEAMSATVGATPGAKSPADALG